MGIFRSNKNDDKPEAPLVRMVRAAEELTKAWQELREMRQFKYGPWINWDDKEVVILLREKPDETRIVLDDRDQPETSTGFCVTGVGTGQ